MLLTELFDDVILSDEDAEIISETAKIVWARRGDNVTRKYKCTSGKRKGRLVSSPSACGQALDLSKRAQFRKTLASKGFRMRRKAKMTKRRNPASLRVQSLNKLSK